VKVRLHRVVGRYHREQAMVRPSRLFTETLALLTHVDWRTRTSTLERLWAARLFLCSCIPHCVDQSAPSSSLPNIPERWLSQQSRCVVVGVLPAVAGQPRGFGTVEPARQIAMHEKLVLQPDRPFRSHLPVLLRAAAMASARFTVIPASTG
jgi:hypothetical protein